MFKAVIFCAAVQAVSFLPFYRVYRKDKEKYGDDLGVPLGKRFVVWLVMCPVWVLPVAAMLGK